MKTPVYQFKITLQGIRPPIWRRFRVDSDVTFRQLHNIVQIVMGWENYHLYQFLFDSYQFTESQMGPGDKPATHRLDEFVQREGVVLGYEYDFGDSWQHEMALEKILTAPRKPGPLCTGGRRACPPEDCGGVWGYMELVEAMQARRGQQYREYKEWLGGYFDAEEFDIEEVNERLADPQLWRN
jgi:hypothetical protein